MGRTEGSSGSLMRLVVPAAIVVLVVAVGGARAATVVSETTWGGSLSEVTNASAVAPDGSVYLTGFTTSFDPFGRDNAFLVKFAADGTFSWQRTFHGTQQFGIDRGNGVAVAPDGSVYVAGQTVGVGNDLLLLKFAPDGALVWQRSWDGGGQETGEGVAVAADGSVYVTGTTDSFGGFGHLVVLRFAPDGTLVWQRIRDVATDAAVGAGQAIAVGADGNIYAAGVVPRAVIGEFDMLLLKLDPQGALVWQRSLAAADVADARGGVTVAGDGSVVVAGGIQAVTKRTAVNDTFVAKFGSDGSLVWGRGFGGDQGDFPGGVVVRGDGTVLVGGETASFGAGSDDAFLLQLDPGGRGSRATAGAGPDSITATTSSSRRTERSCSRRRRRAPRRLRSGPARGRPASCARRWQLRRFRSRTPPGRSPIPAAP